MAPEKPFLDELQGELEEWQRQGLVSSVQARRILAHYGLVPPAEEEARRTGRLAAIVAILGAALVGAGVILFVASNWEQMDRPQKVALLLAALVAVYGIGYRFKYRPGRYPLLGAAFIFLGSLVFGGNVYLIAESYDVSSSEPLLLAIWSAGAFATAYAAASRPALYLALLAAVAWYQMQLDAWRVGALGAVGVVGLAAFVPYGFLLLSLGELQRSFRRAESFAAAFAQVGLSVALAPLVVFCLAGFWRSQVHTPDLAVSESVEMAIAQIHGSFAAFALLATLLAVAAMARFGWTRASLLQGAGVLLLVASSLVAVVHPFQYPEVYGILFNVVLLASILWAVVVGLWSRRESFINVALVFFVLLVFARYVDSFFTFMDRSMAFIVAGALLLGGGYLLERSRRGLLRRMQDEGGESQVT